MSIVSACFSVCLILALEEELLMLFKGGIFAFSTSMACWVSRPGGWWVILHVGFAQYGFLSTPCSTSQVTTAGCSGLKSWRAGGEKVTLAWLKLKARNYICLMVCFDPNLPCVVPHGSHKASENLFPPTGAILLINGDMVPILNQQIGYQTKVRLVEMGQVLHQFLCLP